jgi:hypothetical protein
MEQVHVTNTNRPTIGIAIQGGVLMRIVQKQATTLAMLVAKK